MLPKQTVNYRRKHIIIIVSVIYLIISQLEQYLPFLHILERISYFVASIVFFLLLGTFEKKDEFTKASLSKATEITFYILLAAIFIFSCFIFDITSETANNLCLDIVLGAIGLRSILFLIFDHTPAEKEEE